MSPYFTLLQYLLILATLFYCLQVQAQQSSIDPPQSLCHSICESIESGNKQQFLTLIESASFEVDKLNSKDCPCIPTLAAISQEALFLHRLLKSGAKTDTIGQNDLSPLMQASLHNRYLHIYLLRMSGVSIELKNRHDQDALYYAEAREERMLMQARRKATQEKVLAEKQGKEFITPDIVRDETPTLLLSPNYEQVFEHHLNRLPVDDSYPAWREAHQLAPQLLQANMIERSLALRLNTLDALNEADFINNPTEPQIEAAIEAYHHLLQLYFLKEDWEMVLESFQIYEDNENNYHLNARYTQALTWKRIAAKQSGQADLEEAIAQKLVAHAAVEEQLRAQLLKQRKSLRIRLDKNKDLPRQINQVLNLLDDKTLLGIVDYRRMSLMPEHLVKRIKGQLYIKNGNKFRPPPVFEPIAQDSLVTFITQVFGFSDMLQLHPQARQVDGTPRFFLLREEEYTLD